MCGDSWVGGEAPDSPQSPRIAMKRPPARRRRSAARLDFGRLFVEEMEPRQLLATFTVTNTLDGISPVPAGSFRDAIQQANATPGPDRIEFNIPGPGVQTIVTNANS